MVVLGAVGRRLSGLGHIDCCNDAVEILGFRTQHWTRTCFFFLPPTEVKVLGRFVTIRDGSGFFSADPDAPFRPDAPLIHTYGEYITSWLTASANSQGVHSHIRMTPTRHRASACENK